MQIIMKKVLFSAYPNNFSICISVSLDVEKKFLYLTRWPTTKETL